MDLDCKEVERLKELVPYKTLAPTPNEIINYIEQLQSNWNSLRKCIIGIIEEARDELNTIIHTTDINTEDGLKYVNQCSREFDVIRKNLEIALDKMNELDGKK